jgi:hypothetical protein
MSIDILAEVKFTDKEEAALIEAAAALGKTKEEVVREAVRFFVAECVPTQKPGKSLMAGPVFD